VKRWRIEGEPSPEVLDELAAVLTAGGVALLPTDTIYGLHAIATNERAAARIAALKGRGQEKAFVIIAATIEQLRDFGAQVPNELAEVWPAPLTAILVRGSGTVAARIPALDWLRALLERTGPLISTSANRTGEPPVTSPDALVSDMRDDLDALLDAGLLDGKPSTIVSFTGASPQLIREGQLEFAQILRKSLRKGL
jgi:L-threonylcarbamoyladenylate synthase